jgi:uncharacterized protein
MRFNVAQLLRESPGAIRWYEVDEAPYAVDDGVHVVEPIAGRVHVARTNRGVVVEARLRTRVRQECARCLRDVTSPIAIRFAEEYFPTVDPRTGLPVGAPEDGVGFMLTETHELDLREPVRQTILVEQPMQPLCRAECAGLCPTCGQDLNEWRCACDATPADARLAPLAEWLRANQGA